MGSILELAKRDVKFITNAGGFDVELKFTSPSGLDTATVNGLGTKHHLKYDDQGNPVNAKNVHCSVCEDFLTEAGYPVRNANDEVSLVNHKVEFKDSTGLVKKYSIDQSFPDETLGLLVFILGDHE